MPFFLSQLYRTGQRRNSDVLALAFLFSLAALAFSNTFATSAFIRDDRYIVTGNPLLQSWNSLPKLLTTGYWEGALGTEAPVQEFRPALMLSYAVTALLFGFIPWIFHLTNLLLHATNTLLLFLLLKRRCSFSAALGAGALFAVLPVHVEAVAYLSGRSELLVCFFLLLTWLELERDKPRMILGLFWFACSLFSKEQAVLFPAVLAMDDWASHGRHFWRKERRYLYVWLAAFVLIYLVARISVLADPFHGGSNYFPGKSFIVRLLTMSRFALEHYLWPAITGLGLQSEFVRPFFPDAQTGNPSAWLILGLWIALFSSALAQLLRRRSRWAFWTLAGLVWILPVSNLVFPLDTIGAERFLYLPSMGLCVLLSEFIFQSFAKQKHAAYLALALLAGWYGTATFRRNRVWASDMAYYGQAVRDNPFSAGSRSGLGVALLDKGRREEAERSFRTAAALNPNYAPAYYNLGKIYYEKGDWDGSENWFKQALARGSKSVDAWLFLGIIEEKRGNLQSAIDFHEKALSLQPWNYLAHFNLGRFYLMKGRKNEALEHFERFLSLAPNDPEAPAIRGLVSRLKS